MKKISVGLFLAGSLSLLTSCKLAQSFQAAFQTFQQENSGASATVNSQDLQAVKSALTQAEQAAKAALVAQAQAEQAATAALAAQNQAEQVLASLQNGKLAPTKNVVEKKSKKVVEKPKPIARAPVSAPPVARREVPAPRAPVVAKVAPVTPPAQATAPAEQKASTFITPQAEASLEAEEADAAQAADNYAARRNNAAAAKRSPASVGGATRATDKQDSERKAENEARFKRALHLFESKDEQEQVKLTIIEPDGTRKLREVFVQRMGFEGEQRMLARVISPADLKGAGVLVVATKQRDNQWVYLPSSKQTRKVVVAEQKGVILGSELRYEDFNPAAIRRSSVELIKQERMEGKTYDIFEAIIPPGTVPYDKAWVWIDPKSEMPIQIEYFVTNEKVKRIEFSDYYKVGDIWRPAKLSIKNLKTKRGTDIEISNVKVNSGLPADRLSVEALSKVW